MVIHTFNHEYPVSHVKEISDVMQSCICRNTAGDGLCRILMIRDRALFPGIIAGLADPAGSAAFSDFIEHFIYDDALCIVMKYTQGITLRDKLETESFSLPEKLELARRILERMILQELPDYFLARCASPDTIIVEEDQSLGFNYPIEDIDSASACTREDAMVRVGELLSFIFADEVRDHTSAEVVSFIASLPHLTPECDLIGLYSVYHDMMQAAVSSDPLAAQEQSFWHQLWEKIKKIASKLRRLLMFLLLAAAAAYLIYTIGDARESGVRYVNFERIGTVDIK